MEWNYTKGWISGMTNTISWLKSYGWFYNHSVSYIWNLGNGTTGHCNQTGTVLRIKTVVDDGNNRDMDASYVDGTNAAQGIEWAVFTFASGPLKDYCVATSTDCTRLMVYTYHAGSSAAVGSTTLPTCSARRYLRQSSSVANSVFAAGDTYSFNITVFVPKGIPSGNVTQSTMTLTAA